jgi:hypothetical protein
MIVTGLLLVFIVMVFWPVWFLAFPPGWAVRKMLWPRGQLA